jgi:hypothetical protein
MRWIAWVGAMMLASSISAGCAALGPARPTVAGEGFTFREGWGSQSFSTPPEKAHEVLLEAMTDLKMRATNRSRGATPAEIVIDGQVHDGRHIRVVVRPGDAGSNLTCRVGRFGDEALCKALMERVGVRLGTLPAAAIPEEPPTSSPLQSLFSKSAVPDATMLREQADAGYRDSANP